MRKISTLLLFILPFFVSAQTYQRGITATNGQFVGFLEFRPSDYSSTAKHPLIIFLHGIGEKGNGTTQLNDVNCCGIPSYIRGGNKMRFTWMGKTESFVVLSPQLSASYDTWQPFYTEALINYAIANLNIDPDRIFLTGLSLGGGGTWNFASSSQSNAERLAGIAPVVAPCMMSNGCNIAKASLPVMAIHVLDDKDASASCTINAIASINACGPAVTPNLIMYTSGGHYVWIHRAFDTAYTYQNPNIYEFFLAQNRKFTPNKKPSASGGGDVAVAVSSGRATLSAGASSDPDGSIVRYIWSKVSGPAAGTMAGANTASLSLSGLTVAGTYKYQLKVVDNRAEWSTDEVTITVGASGALPNLAPLANAGVDEGIVLPVNSISLSGSGSKDSDGSIAAYAWTKISGPSAFAITTPASVTTTVTGLVVGTYTFRLTVTDNKGLTGVDDVIVTVSAAGTPPANLTPVAAAGGDAVITLPTASVALSGSASKDNDGTIKSYEWTKISGPATFTISAPSAVNTTVASLVQGVYIFRLTIKDDKDAAAYDDVKITVNAASSSIGNKAPVVNAGPDQSIPIAWNYFPTVNGALTIDPDGWIETWQWTMLSGPTPFNIVNPTAFKTRINGLVAGTYVFRLTVVDNKGGSAYDDITINMTGPGGTTGGGTPTENILPVVNAGADQTIPVSWKYFPLINAALTTDADGWVESWTWSKVSGPSSFTIVSPNAIQTKVNNLVAGVYVFRMTVIDNKGGTSYDDVTINISTGTVSSGIANLSEADLVTAMDRVSVETLSVFPNPARTTFNLQYITNAVGKSVVNIYDVSGKLVKAIAFEKTQGLYQKNIDISSFVRGIYLVEVRTGDKIKLHTKLIKQ